LTQPKIERQIRIVLGRFIGLSARLHVSVRVNLLCCRPRWESRTQYGFQTQRGKFDFNARRTTRWE